MKREEQKNLAKKLLTLSVFRNLIEAKPLKNLINYLKSDGDGVEKATLYGEFVYSLGSYGNSFSDFLTRAVFEDENYYIVGKCRM